MNIIINIMYTLIGVVIGLIIALAIEYRFWSLNLFYEWLKEKFKTK